MLSFFYWNIMGKSGRTTRVPEKTPSKETDGRMSRYSWVCCQSRRRNFALIKLPQPWDHEP